MRQLPTGPSSNGIEIGSPMTLVARSTVGGDFDATASATANFTTNNSFPVWASSGQMATDVQGWLDTPATNFGWVVIGTEGTQQSAKRFDSRENPNAANRPKLRVFYTVVP